MSRNFWILSYCCPVDILRGWRWLTTCCSLCNEIWECIKTVMCYNSFCWNFLFGTSWCMNKFKTTVFKVWKSHYLCTLRNFYPHTSGKNAVTCGVSLHEHSSSLTMWILVKLCINLGEHRGSVDWGTALQAGRSWVRFPMVSLEFFIDIILPATLWPWGWLSL